MRQTQPEPGRQRLRVRGFATARNGLLALVCLPALALAALAADPGILGGATALAPAPEVPALFLLCLCVGFVSGILCDGGGPGGAFIILPALMSAGMRGILALGADLLHLFIVSLFCAAQHGRSDRTALGPGLCLAVGGTAGACVAATWVQASYDASPPVNDLFLTAAGLAWLLVMAVPYHLDFMACLREPKSEPAKHEEERQAQRATEKPEELPRAEGLPGFIQSLAVPPMAPFDQQLGAGGRKVSALVALFLGLPTGFLTGLLGSAGGLLAMPVLVQVIGMTPVTAAGTAFLAQGITAGPVSTAWFGASGTLTYVGAVGLTLGALSGAHLGTPLVRAMQPAQVKGLFLLALGAAAVNRILCLPQALIRAQALDFPADQAQLLCMAGEFLLLAGALGMPVFGVMSLIQNARAKRRAGAAGP